MFNPDYTLLRNVVDSIDIPDYMIGKRVQIPAWSDRWMMGDRYGEIISGRNVLDANNDKRQYRVKLDKSGKLVKFFSDDLTLVD